MLPVNITFDITNIISQDEFLAQIVSQFDRPELSRLLPGLKNAYQSNSLLLFDVEAKVILNGHHTLTSCLKIST